MPSDIHAQRAQLLNQSPNFRPARSDLFRNLRAADNNGSVAHEQADDAAQANVCRLVHGRQAASFCGSGDGGNYKQSLVVGRWQIASRGRLRRVWLCDGLRTTGDHRRTTALYAGCTRKLISTAVDECVSAPTEMKSTPVSA